MKTFADKSGPDSRPAAKPEADRGPTVPSSVPNVDFSRPNPTGSV